MTIIDTILRLALSSIFGGIIGYERERKGHPAGLRTHLLVSMGSALIMIISIYGFPEKFSGRDPARIAAQVVSGIGFIGAGTIFKEGPTVRGLTTATSLWIAAGVGMSVGAGLYMASLIAVTISIMALSLLNVIERRSSLINRKRERIIYIYCDQKEGLLEKIEVLLKEKDMPVIQMTIRPSNSLYNYSKETTTASKEVKLKVSGPNEKMLDALDRIADFDGVESVYWKNVLIEADQEE